MNIRGTTCFFVWLMLVVSRAPASGGACTPTPLQRWAGKQASKETETFSVPDAEWQLTWSLRPLDEKRRAAFSGEVYRVGDGQRWLAGTFDSGPVDPAGLSGESSIHESGNFFLVIRAQNLDWTLGVLVCRG